MLLLRERPEVCLERHSGAVSRRRRPTDAGR